LSGAQVFDFDGVGGDSVFLVEDFDLDEVGTSGLGSGGKSSGDGEFAERHFAHDTGDDDEGQEHAEDEVQQVVAGVDGGDADSEGDEDEVLSFAGEAEATGRAQAFSEAA
jgi:hypothetical protein